MLARLGAAPTVAFEVHRVITLPDSRKRESAVTESHTIVCPECETLQQGDAPFCENCGYRLGRAPDVDASTVQTEVEHQQITAEDLARYKADKSADAAVTSSRELMVPTEVEGHPAITPEQAAAARDGTEVEGLRSVDGGVPTEPANPAVSPTEASGLHVASGPLRQEARSRWLLWGAAWVVSIVATAMVAVWGSRSDEPAQQASIPTPAAPGKLPVAAASFEAGLRENVRAFILRTCLKVADDNSACDQDELLAGEFPTRQVDVARFELDKLEVTVGQYRACVRAGACEPVDWSACKVYTHQGLQISLRVPRSLQAPSVSVTCVRREDAGAYCEHAGGRLPTPDEWEYAARGTDRRIFPWGASWDAAAANWGEMDVTRFPVVGTIDGFEWVAPPGQFPDGESPLGAFDMAGNVAEWVAGEPAHVRGGAWTSSPFELRTTGRTEIPASTRRTDIGFRCAY